MCLCAYVISFPGLFCYRHQLQAGHSLAPLQEAGMESRIQVLKGPFNILQLAQDKRAQFASPGLFSFNHLTDKSFKKTEKPDCLILSVFLFFRHNRHSLHCRLAKLHARQDGGAHPRLLSDRAKQLH